MGRIKKVVSQKCEITVDIICDLCGESVKNQWPWNSTSFSFMLLKTKWGYGSKHDGETWEAYICEECVLQRFEPCIKFEKS